mgnify:CR=1 FL=1
MKYESVEEAKPTPPPPEPEPQAVPVFDINPVEEKGAQPATPFPALDTYSREVEAVPVTARIVVVALVPVELMKVKFCKVVEPVARMLAD